MTRDRVYDYVPWEDYYLGESKSPEINSIKKMLKDIKRAIRLNKRTINEKPKRSKKWIV